MRSSHSPRVNYSLNGRESTVFWIERVLGLLIIALRPFSRAIFQQSLKALCSELTPDVEAQVPRSRSKRTRPGLTRHWLRRRKNLL